MKKLHRNLTVGIASIIIIYGIFFACQTIFAQSFNRKQDTKADSIIRQEILKLNNEVIQRLDLKVELMEKYVDAGQKNLDLWLKLLAFILTVFIGFSVYSGLQAREKAKDELAEIRFIKEDIGRAANEAEDRLKQVKDKITEIENSAVSAKDIKDKLTLQLDELSQKKDLVLNVSQTKLIDETIYKSKEDLQKTGIETLKNLYLAKAL